MTQRYHPTRATRAVLPALRRRSMMPLLLSLAVALSTLPLQASHAAGTPAPSVATQLDTYLRGLAGQDQFSGAALVARKGTVLLSKGYGLADRARRVPNTPATKYPVGGVSASFSVLGMLWLEEHGQLPDQAPICRYIARCPAAWKPITIHMLLDGTAQLPNYEWGQPGHTTAQSIRALQTRPLDGTPGSAIDYQNSDTLVEAAIIEKVTGEPWATFLQRTIFGPAGMTRSGRVTDALVSPARALDYSGSMADPNGVYNDFYAAYATAPDVYAYDNALFGGKLLAGPALTTLVTPRAAVSAPPTGIAKAHYGDYWVIGQVVQHRVIYTIKPLKSFQTANLRFPEDGVTIVVTSNDDQNNVADIAIHLAALVFGQTLAATVIPAHAVAPARAVVATFRGHGSVGAFPFAFTPGALWFPTQSPNGYLGTVTRVDARTGRVVATIDVSARGVARPEQGEGDVAVVHGQVWAVDSGAQTLVRIDPATNKVVATIPLGIPAASLASADDTLWATADPALGDAIAHVDLRTRKIVAVLKNAGHPNIENAATPDALWYIATDTEQVVRVDAATNKVVATISAGPMPQTVFVGAGAVWVGDASGALVSRIDPRTNKVVASIKTDGYPGNRRASVDSCACRYAAGAGAVWVIANNTTLLRIDPQTNTPVASLTFNEIIGRIGLGEGSVWVATDDLVPYIIYRVDPQAMAGS